MAGNIKGITIQIGADTTKLSSALNSANKAIKSTQSELKSVEKALKLDPTNINLLKDKQQLLTDKISETTSKLDALKQAQDQLDAQGVDKNSQEYQELQRNIDLCESELKQLNNEAKEFGSAGAQQVAAVGEKFKEVGQKISDVGGELTTKVTLPLAAVGTAAVASFAEVDKTMQLTNATMGNTEEEAKLLNDAMKEAAANSTFGMSDAATATLNFARAGLDAEQAAAALAPAMNLAAGEGGNLDTVSGGLVATINGFGDSFEQTSKYADVFAAACNNSALDVDGLSDAMSVAAPIFSAAGYSVEDAALYMGTMANAGIESSVAANSLKTGLARLVSPAKEGAAMMDELGICVTNADGSMKDSVIIQSELHDAFANLSESEQLAAASAIFGKNQMSNWLALINTAPDDVWDLQAELNGASFSVDDFANKLSDSGLSIDEMKSNLEKLGVSQEDFMEYLKDSGGDAQEFAESLLEISDAGVSMQDVTNALGGDLGTLQSAMDGTKGTTDEMAEAMMSGFGGSLESLKSSIDVAVTSLGEALAPTILKVSDAIQGAVDWFNGLSEEQQQMIAKIGLVVAAIGPLLLIVGKVISLAGTIMSLAPAIGAAITVMTGPIGLVVAAIAAVVAIGVALYKNWDTIKEKASEIRSHIKEKWEDAKAKVSESVENMKSAVSEKWEDIKSKIANSAIGETVSSVWETAKQNMQTKLDNMKEAYDTHGGGLKGTVAAVMTNVKDKYSSAFNTIDSVTGGKLSAVASKVNSKMTEVRGTFTNKMEEAKTNMSNKLENVKSTFTTKMGSIASKVSDKMTEVKNSFTGKIQEAHDVISGIIEKIKKLFDISLKLDIKLPHISVQGGEAPFGIAGKGRLPSFSVDWYDKGGIFDHPSIIGVGEKRPEFVGALDDLRAIVREESGFGSTNALLSQMVTLMSDLVEQGGRPITVNQTINAQDTSYSGQQKQAAREFKNMARALT